MHPFLILAIGIGSILGLILFLRVNAFLALIISALLVSLLAPGAPEEQMTRVAVEFGVSCGKIGIVIALAAIIGDCMMLSGAADRIVQAFLRMLGEKRASWALMASGWILAVPVFFDTVFYLLVPLARSLYGKTGKNYLLYILAISAGGAITHTLVPPTPGPLVMASTLGIDVGVMILVGGLIAMPSAIVALLAAYWFDAKLNIPFRNEAGEPVAVNPEEAATADLSQLPPLWLSALPVALPVLLISLNTALVTVANNEHTPRLQISDIQDRDGLVAVWTAPTNPAEQHIVTVAAVPELAKDPAEAQQQIVDALNAALTRNRPQLYHNEAFDSVLQKRWRIQANLDLLKMKNRADSSEFALWQRQLQLDGMLQKDLSKLQPHDLERTNRVLLEVLFPNLIKPHNWNTPARQAANWSGLFGDANFALLLSTLVAIYLYWQQKKPTFDKISQVAETALMSGGTIILITAAGGAFGAMLKTANIGTAIEALFKSDGSTGAGPGGMVFLLMGYIVAALLKVAQGSSTTAMIVVSGMLAAMISSPDQLGYHPVYLATAIGAGSLLGSWMNDSGFWIFAKMGRLTETEALKSWTLLLVVLSITSLVATLALATIMPLV